MNPAYYTIGIFVVFALLGWLWITIMKEEENDYQDPFVMNMMPNYSSPIKGFALGVLVKSTKVGDRYLVEYSPRDVDKSFMKDRKQIENVEVAIDKEKMLVMPKGTLSARRDIIILLPKNPEDFPSELKVTRYGRALMAMTESINVDNVEIATVREGSDRKTNLVNKIGGGELSEKYVEMIEEIAKTVMKTMEKEKDRPQPPTSAFRPPTNAY